MLSKKNWGNKIKHYKIATVKKTKERWNFMNEKDLVVKVIKKESEPVIEIIIEIGEAEEETLDTNEPSIEEMFDAGIPDISELFGHDDIVEGHYYRFPRKNFGNGEC